VSDYRFLEVAFEDVVEHGETRLFPREGFIEEPVKDGWVDALGRWRDPIGRSRSCSEE
jgi:hypothetical protein